MSSPSELHVTIYVFNYLLDWRFTVWILVGNILKDCSSLFPWLSTGILLRDYSLTIFLYTCWKIENLNLESKVQSSHSYGRFWFSNYLVLRACTECLTPPKCSKSFRVRPWEQEKNKKGASMLINSNAYYEGQLQWCANRHQKGYTDVSQPRMQDSAFNVESQRIYSCCCVPIFNEWSRKDHSARKNLL